MTQLALGKEGRSGAIDGERQSYALSVTAEKGRRAAGTFVGPNPLTTIAVTVIDGPLGPGPSGPIRGRLDTFGTPQASRTRAGHTASCLPRWRTGRRRRARPAHATRKGRLRSAPDSRARCGASEGTGMKGRPFVRGAGIVAQDVPGLRSRLSMYIGVRQWRLTPFRCVSWLFGRCWGAPHVPIGPWPT